MHLINLIQPHGVLLIVSRTDLRIRQVSENTALFAGIAPADLLDHPLADFIPEDELKNIQHKIERRSVRDRIPLGITFQTPQGPLPCMASVHSKEASYVLIELEAVTATGESDFTQVYQNVKYITAMLKEARDTEEIGQIAASEIKELSGFDRVMIYQFDGQWNGTVIAEARSADMEPYLHLRFPASDIPSQTRELYLRNPYRLIPDRDFTPVRLTPVVNPVTRAFTDLSDCTIRSVANVHLEYLRNMRVMASMSTPIIIDNKLWGLISCHHKTPLFPSYAIRSAFELLAGILSVQIIAKEREQTLTFRSQLQEIKSHLLKTLYGNPDFLSRLLSQADDIMTMFRVQGIAISYDARFKQAGRTPDAQMIQELIHWLQLYHTEPGIFVTDNLPELFRSSASFSDLASGLLAIPLNPKKGGYLLCFRTEVIQNVDWGGNPNEAIRFEPDGKNYHPRN